ncbi:hypothetical protein [Ramlibacter humi]|uniref:GGDEF domain-containing protein n=1 Tax=Ramlibacter humi TaxID=2530451 RepID=A0A4Z0BIR1_9BURK|nr:hypothetical protein [Ramlibacter humi]TFY98299.1 hypothetical protein EZ216_17065 [Ramlibacter humi]
MDTVAASESPSTWQPPRRSHPRTAGWWRRITGRWLRRPTRPLLDLHAFLDEGAGLMAGTSRLVTLLVFDFEELDELRKLYGEDIRRAAVHQVGAALQSLAAGRGLAAHTGPARFALLLKGFTHDEAMVTVFGALGTPCRFEMEADGGEVILVPDVVAGECSRQPGALAKLHDSLAGRVQEDRHLRQAREQHLRRARERYISRPSDLQSR